MLCNIRNKCLNSRREAYAFGQLLVSGGLFKTIYNGQLPPTNPRKFVNRHVIVFNTILEGAGTASSDCGRRRWSIERREGWRVLGVSRTNVHWPISHMPKYLDHFTNLKKKFSPTHLVKLATRIRWGAKISAFRICIRFETASRFLSPADGHFFFGPGSNLVDNAPKLSLSFCSSHSESMIYFAWFGWKTFPNNFLLFA